MGKIQVLIDFIMPLFYKIFPPSKKTRLVMLEKHLEEGERLKERFLQGMEKNDEGYEQALKEMKTEYEKAVEITKKNYKSRKEKWNDLIMIHDRKLLIVKKDIEEIKREIGNDS